MNPSLPIALPRYQSEVEHFVARHSGNPDSLNWQSIMDDFYAGVTVEECGRKIIEEQQNTPDKDSDQLKN